MPTVDVSGSPSLALESFFNDVNVAALVTEVVQTEF